MINVNYGVSSSTIRSAIVDENTTIRDFLNDHDMDYGRLVVSLDAETIRGEALDSTFKDFGIGVGSRDKCYLLCVIKADNAASITVAGSVAMIATKVPFETLEKIEKYKPEALSLKDETGEEVFKVTTGFGEPYIGKYGIKFTGDKNAAGNAAIVLQMKCDGDPVDTLFDEFGATVSKLGQVEYKFDSVLAEIDASKRQFASIVTRI